MLNYLFGKKKPPKELSASKFLADERVAKGIDLILEALEEAKEGLKGPTPPDPSKVASYEALLKEFETLRGGALWYPYLGSGLGNGPLVELCDGSVKYDMINGIGPHIFGHSHQKIVKSALQSALSDTIMQGHLQQNEQSFLLCKELTKAAKMDHCFLTSSGVMANENGLKILFQKKSPASRVFAFERCFMGRTLAVSQITDKPAYRSGLPDTIRVDYIPFFDEKDPGGSLIQSMRAIEDCIKRHPGKHALFVFELVQGEGGFYPGTTHFFKTIMERLKKEGISIMIDEVQTFGRLGELFATNYFGLHEFVDVIAIGKVSQVCATLFKESVRPKAGLLSQTFTSSASAIFASLSLLKALEEGGMYGKEGRVEAIHRRFCRNFEAIEKRNPGKIKGPYGLGSMIAFTPYKGEYKEAKEFADRLYQNGVITFIAGSNPTRVRLLVPILAIEDRHIDEVCSLIEKTL